MLEPIQGRGQRALIEQDPTLRPAKLSVLEIGIAREEETDRPHDGDHDQDNLTKQRPASHSDLEVEKYEANDEGAMKRFLYYAVIFVIAVSVISTCMPALEYCGCG